VRLDVPVGVDITGLVLLHTSSLNLLETPLRQVDIASAKVAAKIDVPQAERSGQSAQLRVIPGRVGIVDDFDLPVILGVSNSKVAVARNFPVSLGDGSSDLVRVEVAAGLSVDKTNDVAVANVSDLLVLGIVIGRLSVGVEEPVVVGVLVVVASNLLLSGALRVGLDMRVKKTTTVAHVLECGARSECNLQWAVLADFSAPEVGLEERGHLCIARAAVLQDEEVDVEREKVDNERNHNETDDSESQVCGKLNLWNPLASQTRIELCMSTAYLGHLQVTKLVPKILNRVDTNKRSTEHANPLDTADTANAKTSAEEPESPLGRESLMAHVVEPRPAEHSGESEEQKHTVEQDEPADRGVAVLEEHHSRHEPDGRALEVQLFGSEVREGNAERAESGVEQAHESVVELFGVSLAGLELEGAVVVSEVAGEANKHLSERRVDIEVELALEVVGTELAEAVIESVSDCVFISQSGWMCVCVQTY
jgi:hypothetical protein